MEEFLIYILGWLTFVVIYYVCEVYVLNDKFKNGKVTKKLILYRGFKYGILSWVGVFGAIAVVFFGWIFTLDEKIEKKLNS